MDNTQPTSPLPRLDQAIHLAKSGQKAEAHQLLRRIVGLQPVNQAAWLWLSAVTPDKAEAEAAIAQARKINPNHSALAKAEQWLTQRFSEKPDTQKTPVMVATNPPPAASQTSDGKVTWLHSVALVVVGVVVLVGLLIMALAISFELNATAQTLPAEPVAALPAPQPALDRGLESEAADTQSETRPDQPEDNQIDPNLAANYLAEGLALRYQGLIEAAQTQFEAAVKAKPDLSEAQREYDLATDFIQGKQSYQQGEWEAAISSLEAVYRIAPDYPNVRDLLFSAYYNQGLRLHAEDDLTAAQAALQMAISLRPDLSHPRLELARVEFALAPETTPDVHIPLVSVEERLVVVGIAEQRMRVYEKDKVVFDFVVSTGEPGRDTAIGEFEIQNKIDMAYASTWNLDMPFWMGIYWSGPLQNGIHSLPTVRHTGQTLWDGYLGQRVSYGCVILGEDDASTLYNWADVGTKVIIVPSLESWSPPTEQAG